MYFIVLYKGGVPFHLYGQRVSLPPGTAQGYIGRKKVNGVTEKEGERVFALITNDAGRKCDPLIHSCKPDQPYGSGLVMHAYPKFSDGKAIRKRFHCSSND